LVKGQGNFALKPV